MLLKNRRYFTCYLFFLGNFFIGIKCQPQTQATQQQNNNQLLMQKLSINNMNFAFKLYKLMAEQPDAMLSPLIISMVLTITSFGAEGDTLRQVYEALDLNGFSDRLELAKGYSAILNSLEVLGDTSAFILNRIAVTTDLAIKKPLQDVLLNHFGIKHVPIHYANDVAKADTKPCAEQSTKFNFTTIFSFKYGNTPPEAPLAFHVASVLYFNGMWTQQFCKENIHPEEFYDASGKKQTVEMMNTRAQFYIVEDGFLDAKILRLDYTGNRFAMYVILPNKLENFQILKNNLNAERFQLIKNNMRVSEVMVKLPKYLGDRLQFLHLDLKNLGMTDLENESRADLPEMAEVSASGRLFAKQALYNAHVELGDIDESTFNRPDKPNLVSVFAASSGNGSTNAYHAISYRLGQRQNQQTTPLKEFYANHPFVFIIYDALTGLILFMGNLDNFAKVSYRV